MKVHVYVGITDANPRQKERWVGYIIKMGNHKVYNAWNINETYHKSILIALVEALDRFNRPADILIHIQDVWVATMIEKNAETWQFNGWTNRDHKKIKNWEYWQRAYNKLQVLRFNGKLPAFEGLTKEEHAEVMHYIRLKQGQEE